MPTLPPLDISDAELAALREDARLIKDMMKILRHDQLCMSDKIAVRLIAAYDDQRQQFENICRRVEGLAGPSVG